MQMYGWKAGLKTGMYYLRSAAAVYPVAPLAAGLTTVATTADNSDKDTSGEQCVPVQGSVEGCVACSA